MARGNGPGEIRVLQDGLNQTASGAFTDEPMLLRATEVARLLRLSRSKVYQMMSDGTLPVVRIDRAIRVPREALIDWVRKQTTQAA
jgi:excisionase family DNA binding protein